MRMTVTSRTRYKAQATREGQWWVISVPGVRGVHTQARRLGQIEETVREALALVLEVDPGSFDIDYDAVLPGPLAELTRHAAACRQEAEAAQAEASRVMIETAERLRDAGFSVRDVGALLGVSFQRAAQLLA